MIRAIYFPDQAAFERHKTPGSFRLEPHRTGEAGLFAFEAFCPCGCGSQFALLASSDVKSAGDGSIFLWNGSKTEPTLNRSVYRFGHWHGWLRNGYWVAC